MSVESQCSQALLLTSMAGGGLLFVVRTNITRDLKINDMDFVEKYMLKNRLLAEMAKSKCHNCPKLSTHVCRSSLTPSAQLPRAWWLDEKPAVPNNKY
jgi:hypothetical protein